MTVVVIIGFKMIHIDHNKGYLLSLKLFAILFKIVFQIVTVIKPCKRIRPASFSPDADMAEGPYDHRQKAGNAEGAGNESQLIFLLFLL